MASDFHRPRSLILSPTMFSLRRAVAPVARSALAVMSAMARDVEGEVRPAWRSRLVITVVGSGWSCDPQQQRWVSAVAWCRRR